MGILIDTDGDIMIRGGSVAIGDNTQDIVERVLNAYPGEFKEHPLLGANIRRYIGATGGAVSTVDIKQQLKMAGVQVSDIIISEDNSISITVK